MATAAPPPSFIDQAIEAITTAQIRLIEASDDQHRARIVIELRSEALKYRSASRAIIPALVAATANLDTVNGSYADDRGHMGRVLQLIHDSTGPIVANEATATTHLNAPTDLRVATVAAMVDRRLGPGVRTEFVWQAISARDDAAPHILNALVKDIRFGVEQARSDWVDGDPPIANRSGLTALVIGAQIRSASNQALARPLDELIQLSRRTHRRPVATSDLERVLLRNGGVAANFVTAIRAQAACAIVRNQSFPADEVAMARDAIHATTFLITTEIADVSAVRRHAFQLIASHRFSEFARDMRHRALYEPETVTEVTARAYPPLHSEVLEFLAFKAAERARKTPRVTQSAAAERLRTIKAMPFNGAKEEWIFLDVKKRQIVAITGTHPRDHLKAVVMRGNIKLDVTGEPGAERVIICADGRARGLAAVPLLTAADRGELVSLATAWPSILHVRDEHSFTKGIDHARAAEIAIQWGVIGREEYDALITAVETRNEYAQRAEVLNADWEIRAGDAVRRQFSGQLIAFPLDGDVVHAYVVPVPEHQVDELVELRVIQIVDGNWDTASRTIPGQPVFQAWRRGNVVGLATMALAEGQLFPAGQQVPPPVMEVIAAADTRTVESELS